MLFFDSIKTLLYFLFWEVDFLLWQLAEVIWIINSFLVSRPRGIERIRHAKNHLLILRECAVSLPREKKKSPVVRKLFKLLLSNLKKMRLS